MAYVNGIVLSIMAYVIFEDRIKSVCKKVGHALTKYGE